MAAAFLQDIRKQIKDGSFHKVYLLTGDEGYLIRLVKRMLLGALVSEGDTMNYHSFELEKVDLSELGELARTYPFFSPKRVIVLDSTNVLKDGKDILPDLFQSLPDTTCIIIIEEKADKRTGLYRWIKSNGYVVEALRKNVTESDVKRYITAWLKNAGKRIRSDDASYLAALTDHDLYLLYQEVNKLIAYTGEKEEVTGEDIDSIVSGKTLDRIFELTEAIAAGSRDKVEKCYRDLVTLREEPLRILYMMTRQYRILFTVYDLSQKGVPDEQIAKASGVHRYFMKRTKNLLKRYDALSLAGSLEACLETEERMKSGRINRQIGLESLLVQLTEGIDGNQCV